MENNDRNIGNGRCQKHLEGGGSLVFKGGIEHFQYFKGGLILSRKITRRTTTSERKHVFASLSKFQIENVRKQVTCT